MKNVIQDCAFLSSGTIATLTGFSNYEDIERVQTELIEYAKKMPEAETWMEVWEKYKRSENHE